jgi:hypothetical protein
MECHFHGCGTAPGKVDPGVVTSTVPVFNTVSGKAILDWTEI